MLNHDKHMKQITDRMRMLIGNRKYEKRTEEWGPGEVQKRIGMSLKEFQIHSDQWMSVVRDSGINEMKETFSKVVKGEISPDQGLILSV